MLQGITMNEHIEIIIVDICCGMFSIYAIHSCAPHLICHHPKEKIRESFKRNIAIITTMHCVGIKTSQVFAILNRIPYSVQKLCNFSIQTILVPFLVGKNYLISFFWKR